MESQIGRNNFAKIQFGRKFIQKVDLVAKVLLNKMVAIFLNVQNGRNILLRDQNGRNILYDTISIANGSSMFKSVAKYEHRNLNWSQI